MFVAASPQLQDRWLKFRAALDAASAPHTGKPTLPLSPLYLFEMPGADHELETAKASAPPGSNVKATAMVDHMTGKVGFDIIW